MKVRARGFTLIELLVVIAIIGIMAGIVLAALGNGKANSKDAKRVSELRQIRNALETYYTVNGKYPACLYQGGTCTSGISLQGSPQMPNVPKDPSGTGYSYAALGSGANCSGYHLGASLENKGYAPLLTDSDTTASASLCTNSAADFNGLTYNAGGSACGTAVDGVAQPTNNAMGETCYDVIP